jgi:YHS domain-containing protein
MEVRPGEAAGGSAEHDGRTYWFCSPVCRQTFMADPTRYVVSAGSQQPAPEPTGSGLSRDDRVYNMFTLIALGTGAAFAYSVFATLLPDALPHGMPTGACRPSTTRPRP